MAVDKFLQIYDENDNLVDYDISANDVKFQDGDDLPTKIAGLAPVATSGSYNDLEDTPTVDQTVIEDSTKAVSGGAVFDELAGKQATLVKGTNLDATPTNGSDNPVTSDGVYDAIDSKLTDVAITSMDGSNASFFIHNNALCISTQNFVTVTATPTITTAIQSDGTCIVTITDNSGNNAELLYSLDGGTPATAYSAAFSISTAGTYTIMATAQESGKPVSDVATSTVTISASSAPTISTVKTSSDMTITATGSGTVVLKVGGSTVANPYTVSRTSSNQTLSVEATNKESDKLITSVSQSITVPKLVVLSQKIQDFCTRVSNDGGSLIFGDAEGTQEAYDAHTILLGEEPELDFLGYKGTKAAPTYLYSVNENCDADAISAVSINNDGLIVASTDKTPSSSPRYHIKWTKYTGVYSTRFAPDITYNGDNRTVNRDFSKLYISAENGFIEASSSTNQYYYANAIIQGFPNSNGSSGVVGVQDGDIVIAKEQKTLLAAYDATGARTIHITRSGGYTTLINGVQATSDTAGKSVIVGSTSFIGFAYMQLKANSPTLILMY